MDSPRMIIIRVPEHGGSIGSEVSSTSPGLSDSEMKLLRIPQGQTISREMYRKSIKNRPNLDEIVTHLNPRHRRLTTMTDDKFLRKKLKNRVAAQNSRDKKKARMEELERLVKVLEEKNETVTQECQRLKTEVASLKEENSQLKEKLSCYCEKANSAWPVEPAVFINDPLQKGQGLSLLTFLFLLSISLKMKLQMNTCSKLKSWLRESLGRELKAQNILNRNYVQRTPSQCLVQVKWWGRQQKTWNPVNG